MADDYPSNPSTSGYLPMGGTASGTFETEFDHDWYKVTLTAGTPYWFSMSWSGWLDSPAAYDGNAWLRLMDGNGESLKSAHGTRVLYGYFPPVLHYVAETSGTYYVAGEAITSDETGDYTVSALVDDEHDKHMLEANSRPITAGASVTGSLSAPDEHDLFKLDVTAGQTYLIELASDSPEGFQLLGFSLDGRFNGAANYEKPGVAEYLVLQPKASGTFYFDLTNSKGVGDYALTVIEAPTDDYVGNSDPHAVLQMNSSISGKLDYIGDDDTFKITLQPGARYKVELISASNSAGPVSLDNMYLRMFENEGLVYSESGDITSTFSSEAGGDFHVTVGAASNAALPATRTANYTLTLTTVDDGLANPQVLSFTPPPGGSPTGNLTLTFSEPVTNTNYLAGIELRDSAGQYLQYGFGAGNGTVAANTLTINPLVPLKPGETYVLSVPANSMADLGGHPLSGATSFSFTTVAPVATGGKGNDWLIGAANSLRLNGGSGTDTAFYDHESYNYYILRNEDGATVVRRELPYDDISKDVLTAVERLMFPDTSYALDIDGTAGMAYRMYRAAFDRTPDKEGLGYWIAHLDNGMSLQTVARSFLASEEFAITYGTSVSNEAFITKLYANVLHREPDAGGFDYYMDLLKAGVDRSTLLVGFSESPENQEAVAQVIGNGFEYVPYG